MYFQCVFGFSVCVFGVFLLCFWCVFSLCLMCFQYVFGVFLVWFECVFGVFLLCFWCVVVATGEPGGGSRGNLGAVPKKKKTNEILTKSWSHGMGEPGGARDVAWVLEEE